ncbi:reverse transcriptase [Gossypium australe]|uniref:Reverse transcriptase n=1 Tax=Gossypium australe TaxID=47621 RepID=A0A5B6V8C8_9ROSI|nr:reverse transcriptase [Gossypium australe]
MAMTNQASLQLPPKPIPRDLLNLLEAFNDVFQTPVGLPPSRLQDHRIPLRDESMIVNMRTYYYPIIQKNEMERLIQKMSHNRIIRDSNSAFASPIVMVKEKDGSWHLCMDYRQLNKLTIRDNFPTLVIEELLDELDLRACYHQIRMHKEDIYKTKFWTHEGHYEFLVMPFGLTNVLSTFQALMNSIFKPLLRKSVLVFFDDILLYSKS